MSRLRLVAVVRLLTMACVYAATSLLAGVAPAGAAVRGVELLNPAGTDAREAGISENGDVAYFVTESALSREDVDQSADVYSRTYPNGEIALISYAAQMPELDGPAGSAAISRNGRWIAFAIAGATYKVFL